MARDPEPYHKPVFDVIVSEATVSHEVTEQPWNGCMHSRVMVNCGDLDAQYIDNAMKVIMERDRMREMAENARQQRGHNGYVPSGPTTRVR